MAIITELAITVSGNKATFSSPVYFYLGDGDCTLAITITKLNLKFGTWNSVKNIVDEVNTAWASMCIIKPDNTQIRINKCEIDDGTLFFKVRKDMMDELSEAGLYKMQIHLYDKEGSDKNRITIPPVTFQVLTPLCKLGDHDELEDPTIDNAVARYLAKTPEAINKFDIGYEYEIVCKQNEDGNFNIKLCSVEDFSMFMCDPSIIRLDFLKVTSRVSTMNEMFKGCSLLESLDVSDWDMSNVITMENMFEGCTSLSLIRMFNTTLDIAESISNELPDRSNTTPGTAELPHEFRSLKSEQRDRIVKLLNSKNWNVAYQFHERTIILTLATEPAEHLYNDININGKTIRLLGKHVIDKVNDSYGDYNYVCEYVSEEDISYCSFGVMHGLLRLDYLEVTDKFTSMRGMFIECNNGAIGGLYTIKGTSKWDTSNVTDMGQMFTNCINLTDVDVSNWNTSKVIKMDWMFRGCSAMHSLDISNFDTSNVTDMNRMFEGCYLLKSLDFSNWTIANEDVITTNMLSGCDNLDDIKLLNSSTITVRRIIEELPDRSNTTQGTVTVISMADIHDLIETLSEKNWVIDTENPDIIESIILKASSTEVGEGDSVILSYELIPANTTQTTIEYIVKGNAVLDGNVLTCNSPGTVTVQAYNADSGIRSNTITITVNEKVIPLESIVLNADKLEVVEGETVQLSYVLNPSDTTQTNVEYIVVGDATLNGNILTCNSAGTISVYVKSTDNPNIPCNTINITVKEEDIVIENYITIEYEGSIARALFENYSHVNDFEVSYNGKDWNTFDNSLDGNYSVAYLRPTKTITVFSNMVCELSVDGTYYGDYSKLKCIDFSKFDASAITKINWFAHSVRTYAKIIMPLNLKSAIIKDTTDPFGSNNITTYIDARGLDTKLHTAVINSLYDRSSITEGTYVANSSDLTSDLISSLESKNWTLVQPN